MPGKKLISYAKETLVLDVFSVPILVLPLTTLLQVFAKFVCVNYRPKKKTV